MHRSSSTTRASDFFIHGGSRTTSTMPDLGEEEDSLPIYDPQSDFAKKEKLHAKFAENAVHVIPVVLIICAFVLWFFSNPEVVIAKDNSIVARIEGLTLDGDVEVTGSKTGLFTSTKLEDSKKPKKRTHKTRRAGKTSRKLS